MCFSNFDIFITNHFHLNLLLVPRRPPTPPQHVQHHEHPQYPRVQVLYVYYKTLKGCCCCCHCPPDMMPPLRLWRSTGTTAHHSYRAPLLDAAPFTAPNAPTSFRLPESTTATTPTPPPLPPRHHAVACRCPPATMHAGELAWRSHAHGRLWSALPRAFRDAMTRLTAGPAGLTALGSQMPGSPCAAVGGGGACEASRPGSPKLLAESPGGCAAQAVPVSLAETSRASEEKIDVAVALRVGVLARRRGRGAAVMVGGGGRCARR